MKLTSVLCLLVVLLGCVSNSFFANAEASAVKLEEGVVHKLKSQSEFHALLETDQTILFEFFATWCGHCKALAPILVEVAAQLKEKNLPVKIVAIDVDEHQKLSSEQQIQGLPTFKILKDKKLVEFNVLKRTTEEILKSIKKEILPDVSKLDASNITNFKEDSDLLVLGHFKDESSEHAKLFHQLATSHRDSHNFGIVNDPSLMDLKTPGESELILYRKSDGHVVKHEGKWTLEDLTHFLASELIPLVGEINEKTISHYIRAEKMILFFFYQDQDQRKQFTPLMEKMAKEFESKIVFGFCNAVENAYYAKILGLQKKWPSVVVHSIHSQLKWIFDQDATIEEKSFHEYLKKCADGTLPPSYKSEENLPAMKKGIYQASAKTFEEVVIKNDKDVFVEFYAPWCQHCNKLQPTMEELAEKVNSDNIMIVQFNAADNDIPKIAAADVEGYPTLKLYKAFEKTKPIDYTKDRTLEDFLSFLSTHAHHKTELESVVRTEL